MRCINCGIAMQRLQRHLIYSLSAHHQARLSRWITNLQTQLPLDAFICHPCFSLLNTEAAEYERLLGHSMVCLGCGKSIRRIRHHNVSMEWPLLAVLLSQNTNYVPSRNNYICHLCWMRANRQAVHDSSRDMPELALDDNAPASKIQVVTTHPPPAAPPQPPLSPHVQSGLLRRENKRSRSPNIFTSLNDKTQCDDPPSPSLLASRRRRRSIGGLMVETVKVAKENQIESKEDPVCGDCSIYKSDDKRSEIFGQLIAEQFKYVHPCVRLNCFIQILKYMQEAKGGHHINELNFEDTQH